MTVHIVTYDNGRIHSVHSTPEAAQAEHDRALKADEIYATGIEEHDVDTSQAGQPVATALPEHTYVVWWRSCSELETGPKNIVGAFTDLQLALQAHDAIDGDWIDTGIEQVRVDPPLPDKCICRDGQLATHCIIPDGKHDPDCPATNQRPDLAMTDAEIVAGQRAWMRELRRGIRERLIAQGKPVPWGLAEHERTPDGEFVLPEPAP